MAGYVGLGAAQVLGNNGQKANEQFDIMSWDGFARALLPGQVSARTEAEFPMVS